MEEFSKCDGEDSEEECETRFNEVIGFQQGYDSEIRDIYRIRIQYWLEKGIEDNTLLVEEKVANQICETIE